MKTKQEIFNQIENYVKDYVPPQKPKDFIPVVYTIPHNGHTDEQLYELIEVVELVEKITSRCIGRVVLGLNLASTPHKQWLGVALLPIQFKTQKVLITNVPYKPIFERAG